MQYMLFRYRHRDLSSCSFRFHLLPVQQGTGPFRVSGNVPSQSVIGLVFVLLVSVTTGCMSFSPRAKPAQETTERTVADFDPEPPALDGLLSLDEVDDFAVTLSEPEPAIEADPENRPKIDELDAGDREFDRQQDEAPTAESEDAPQPERTKDPDTQRSFFSRLFRRTSAAGEDTESSPGESADPTDEAVISNTAEPLPDDRYKLRGGDEIRLEVFREPEMSGIFRLTRPEGFIRHPLLGDVVLKGMTLEEAEASVHQRLAEDFLVNPRVILQLAREPVAPRAPEEADLQVLVMGQVRNPGAVTFQRGERLTLLEAISLAGGFTKGASRNRVRLVREDEDGKRQTIRVRVDDILSGKQGHQNIELKSGDTINVPEVWF